MSFKDKVVIVTGSSSGIGASIAIEFAKEGADVVVIGRNAEKLQKVEKTCEESGNKPLIINADISKESDVERIVKETVDKYGKIDIVVNNAGIVRYAAVADKNILAVYDEVMNTNVRAVIQLTHLTTPYLIKSKGNIVNISSIGGQAPPTKPQFLSYCTSKAALNHITKCVASELASHGVRVNAVSPGPVMTDIAENSGLPKPAEDFFWAKMLSGTALHRISEGKEVADLVLYLASDKSIGITGTNVVIDNGMLLQGNAGGSKE